MKTYLSFIPLLLLAQTLLAQQLPLFTQYREHHSYLNPAAVGWDYFTYKYNFNVALSHRSQWENVEHAPSTQHLRGEYIFRTGGSFSLLTGMNVMRHSTDPFYSTGTFGRLAVLFTENPYYFGIVGGLMVGGTQYRLKTSHLELWEADVKLNTNIDELANFQPNASVGLFFYKQFREGTFRGDNVYGGISIPQVLGLTTIEPEGHFKTKRHFYTLLGYYKYLNEDTFIEPSVWLKTVAGAPPHLDFNLRFQYSNYFWIGAGIATSEALNFEAGFLIGENLKWKNLLKIGYSTHYFLNNTYQTKFGATHEINIGYALDLKKKKT